MIDDKEWSEAVGDEGNMLSGRRQENLSYLSCRERAEREIAEGERFRDSYSDSLRDDYRRKIIDKWARIAKESSREERL